MNLKELSFQAIDKLIEFWQTDTAKSVAESREESAAIIEAVFTPVIAEAEAEHELWLEERGAKILAESRLSDERDLSNRLLGENVDLERRLGLARDVLQDAVRAVAGSHKGSMGSIDNVYLPQIDVKQVERWNDALAQLGAPSQTDGSVYVASRASVPERAQMWRGFRAKGVPIISTWIDEDGEGETSDFTELWDRITAEIRSAERLVLYAHSSDFPLKGALIEAGIALGMNKPVVVCLPGVDIAERSCRPIGSWIRHRLVTRNDDIRSVMDWRIADGEKA